MDTAGFISRLTVRALAGAALGTVLGLLLLMLGVIGNPFWLTAAGIMAAALLTPLTATDRGDAGAR